MEYKEARDILVEITQRKLGKEEKEAVMTAIGVLYMATIAKKSFDHKIERQKAKKQKSTEW
jgi:hypothetical protein